MPRKADQFVDEVGELGRFCSLALWERARVRAFEIWGFGG
jgi:hypothetical protein